MNYGAINVKKGKYGEQRIDKKYLLVDPVRNQKTGQVHLTLVLVLDQNIPRLYQYLKGK
jgi:hypothetical protein